MNLLQWYVLKVVSKQEEKVKANLEVALIEKKLTHAVQEILIPYEKVYEIRDGKKYVKNKSLLPGYLLLYALGFLGVKGWGSSSSPTPLSQAEVNRIIGKTKDLGSVDVKLHTVFVVGEAVEIIDGPFIGFFGKIQEISEEKKTLNVIVKIFDERSTPVELSYTQVKKSF